MNLGKLCDEQNVSIDMRKWIKNNKTKQKNKKWFDGNARVSAYWHNFFLLSIHIFLYFHCFLFIFILVFCFCFFFLVLNHWIEMHTKWKSQDFLIFIRLLRCCSPVYWMWIVNAVFVSPFSFSFRSVFCCIYFFIYFYFSRSLGLLWTNKFLFAAHLIRGRKSF